MVRTKEGVGLQNARKMRRYKTNYNQFYHSKEWKKLRRKALERDNYLCIECKKKGIITPANTVHHIKPLRIDDSRALQLSNLETVCGACHNKLHRERSQTLKKKNANIKNQKSKNIMVFGPNPEQW